MVGLNGFVLRAAMIASGLCLMAFAASAQIPAPAQGQGQGQSQNQQKAAPAKPIAATTQAVDGCFAGYGLLPNEKIKACTDAIQVGNLQPASVAIAYFSRGQAEGAMGDSKASIADYKTSIKLLTDVIRGSAPNSALLFQRGLIYHTLQAFWFRFLVDAKIVEQEMARANANTDRRN